MSIVQSSHYINAANKDKNIMDHCRFTISLTLALTLLLSKQVFAQNTDQADADIEEKQWYQIEIVIFASNNPEAAHEEQWPEELGLSYPESISHIKDTLSAIAVDTIIDDDALSQPSLLLENLAAPAEISDSDQSATDPALEQTQPLVAFSQLADDQLTLSEAANKIIDQYDFRPLFHKAWRQTINDRDNAINIIVTGGEAYDEHYELEGSVKISVERYLHIHTNLWLNQFVSKAGQDQPSWPILPAIPSRIDESNATDLDIAFQARNSFDASNVNLETGAMLNSNEAIDASEIIDNNSVNSLLGSEIETAPATDILSGANKALEQQLQLMSESQFAVERTVVMRQHRRMRSKELHYIDHPLFGMLIKIIPYELPVDELAIEEETDS